MPEQRRRFRAEAVQIVLETGKPIAEVARDLQINEGTLGNWVNTWRRDHPEPDQPLSPTEKIRMNEMEGEIRRLRIETEFLKKQGQASTQWATPTTPSTARRTRHCTTSRTRATPTSAS